MSHNFDCCRKSEVVLHSNLQILEKGTENVLENGLVNTGPGIVRKAYGVGA